MRNMRRITTIGASFVLAAASGFVMQSDHLGGHPDLSQAVPVKAGQGGVSNAAKLAPMKPLDADLQEVTFLAQAAPQELPLAPARKTAEGKRAVLDLPQDDLLQAGFDQALGQAPAPEFAKVTEGGAEAGPLAPPEVSPPRAGCEARVMLESASHGLMHAYIYAPCDAGQTAQADLDGVQRPLQ